MKSITFLCALALCCLTTYQGISQGFHITVSVRENSCSIFPTGRIDCDYIRGGVLPITWKISSGSGTRTGDFANFFYVAPGMHTITATDARGATATETVTVKEITISLSSYTPVTCHRGNDATIVLTSVNGTPLLGFNLFSSSNGSFSDYDGTFTGLFADNYTISSSECRITGTTLVKITQPSLVVNVTTPSVTNVTCNGGNNGKIVVSASGGTGAITYNISPNSGTQSPAGTFNGLTAGNYAITAHDASTNCTTRFTTVGQPTVLSATSTAGSIACNGGTTTVNVAATGGTAPYTGTGSFTKGAGTHIFTVTDANGCAKTTSVTITEPPVLNITTSSTNIECVGSPTGSANVVISGGLAPYTYAWSNGSTIQNIDNLTEGTYTVTATDFNKCTANSSAIVGKALCNTCFSIPPSPVSISGLGHTSTYTNVNLNGTNSTAAIVLPGATVSISFAQTMTYQGGAGCNTCITQQIIGVGGTGTNISCLNTGTNPTLGSRSLNVNTTFTAPTTPGVYYIVQVSDWQNICYTVPSFPNCTGESACTNAIAVIQVGDKSDFIKPTITCPTSLVVNNQTGVCGATVTFDVIAADNCSTSPTITKIAGLESGSIFPVGITFNTFSVTDDEGNNSSCSFNVTVNDIEKPTIVAPRAIKNCSQSNIDLGTPTIADNCSIKSISNDAPIIFPIGTTTVTWTVTDVSDNIAMSTQLVTVSTIAITSSKTDVKCNGGNDGTTTIIANGGIPNYSFKLGINTNNTGIFTGLIAGTYPYTVTDANNCSTTGSIIINQPTPLSISTSTTNVKCNGGNDGTATLIATGGTPNYLFKLGASTNTTGIFTGLTAGTYAYTITDANNCTKTTSITITEPTALSATSTAGSIACNGGTTTVNVNATGGTAPYTGTGSFTKSAGTYSFTVTDANGCTASTSKIVNQATALVLTSTPTNVTCTGDNNGSIDLTVSGGTPGYTYNWGAGQPTTQDRTGLTAGSYTVTVTDGNGCTASKTTVVNTINTLSTAPLSISGISTICSGGSTTLTLVGGNAGTGAMAQWFTGSCGGTSAGTGINSITVAPTATTTYFVRYSGTCNTTTCASITITINTPSVGGTLSPAQNQGCGPQTVNLSVSGINGAVTQWERQANCTGNWNSIGSATLSTITTTTPNQTSCYRIAVTNGVCPTAYSTVSTVTVDKPAVGGRVTLLSNQTATSIALCAGENALLIPKNYVGKIANWQYTSGTSPIWYDLPLTENSPTLTVNGSTVKGTLFYRVVIVTDLGLCTGLASVAYSSAFRVNKKAGCLSPDGSAVNTDVQTNSTLLIQKVYPNPTNDFVNLEMSFTTEGSIQIDIIDLTGRIVQHKEQSVEEGFSIITLNIQDLYKGLYLVRVKDGKNQEAFVKVSKL